MKIQMEKSHLKIELYAIQTSFTRELYANADKTTVLLSHLRNNYAFVVGYCR